MISAWWLALTIPAAIGVGLALGGIFEDSRQADRCSICQYNCRNCPKNKEKSN